MKIVAKRRLKLQFIPTARVPVRRDQAVGVQFCSSATNRRNISGGEKETTSNRMELTAAIRALESLKFSSTVNLYTDSTYLKDGMVAWLKEWKENNWIRENKYEVRNRDLWQKLDQINSEHDIEWHWIAGHSGNKGNERADVLAKSAIPKQYGKN